MWYILILPGILFDVTPACVWCCDTSTLTEHENHQTSNINMKYSGEHNKRQCPDHRKTFAANTQRSQARATPPDVNSFVTRPKPLRLHYKLDCSPIPVFCFLYYSKILTVTKIRLNVCFNEMALFRPFPALIKGCGSYGRNGGQPTREGG